MKKFNIRLVTLAIITTSLASFSKSYATDTFEFYDVSTGELSVFIPNPTLGRNVPFSSVSDQNGACIALGYEKGAPGASIGLRIPGSAVTVNAQGNITGGQFDKYRLANLVCVNLLSQQKWKAVLISDPIHPNSVPFSSVSDQNGACIALGYEKGAPGASNGLRIPGSAVIVNAQGKITGGEFDKYRLANLVCVNRNL